MTREAARDDARDDGATPRARARQTLRSSRALVVS
jgi:hypothetical protein